METWNDQNKSASTFTNQSIGRAIFLTWDNDPNTWNQENGTWSRPNDIYTNQSKSSSSFSNQTKN